MAGCSAPQFIRCLLCECSTIEQALDAHIQYNHMIYNEAVLQVIFNLHYPPLSKLLINDMLEMAEDEANNKYNIKERSFTPFQAYMKKNTSKAGNKLKGSGKCSKKRKETEFQKLKKLNAEETPKSKKPIILTKATPIRKRLQPTVNEMFDDDPFESDEKISPRKRKKKGVGYHDVYSRKETGDKQITSIQKMRQLQENELQCIMDQGTYVQCCDCQKWRMVKEFEDPSLVPEYWVCSMNKDEEANDCNKGAGDDVESDEEFISVNFTCGSMVWVKFSGFPWWPGMVDYCPDVEDSFLVSEDNPKEAAEYHVVFFDKSNNIARAWMKKDMVMNMLDPEEPPKPPMFKNENIKKRYQHAKSMAVDAVNLPKIERIEKYSFASLFTGKWGEWSDESEDLGIEIDARLIGIAGLKPPIARKKIQIQKKIRKKHKTSPENDDRSGTNFHCLKCSQQVKSSRKFVANHLRKHRLSLEEYLNKYDCPANTDKLSKVRQWVQNGEVQTKRSTNIETRKSRSRSRSNSKDSRNTNEETRTKSCTDKEGSNSEIRLLSPTPNGAESCVPDVNDELLNEVLDDNSLEAKDEPIEMGDESSEHESRSREQAEQSKDSSMLMKLVDETDTSEKNKNKKTLKNVKSKASPLRKGTKSSKQQENEGSDKDEYVKPPMSPELLIAIAVINLDPHKDAGASCTDIVAFLSIHFPYFSDHYEECKDMVRRECGMSSSFESGRENFQMKAEINCGDRIHTYVKNNREKICHSMLEPEFLDVLIERFVNQKSMVSPKSRKSPPFSKKMLTHIALMKLHKRATLEQLVILLKFVFPALAQPGIMEAYRKEFLEEIAKSKEIDAKVDNKNITFALKEDLKEEILDQIRACSLENLETVGKSLLNEGLFDLVLPIFQNND